MAMGDKSMNSGRHFPKITSGVGNGVDGNDGLAIEGVLEGVIVTGVDGNDCLESRVIYIHQLKSKHHIDYTCAI